MNRQITKVEASVGFWNDLEPLRKERWYPDLRRAIANFVTDLAAGNPVRERGFSNPRLKGIMHLNLPKDLRLFHVYPDSDTLRLCLVADHKVYGFNGKHMGREAATADKIWRGVEMPVAVSPFWKNLKWKTPAEVCDHPELAEMSVDGLRGLIDDLDQEADSWQKLTRHLKVDGIDDIPLKDFETWADDLIRAQDCAYSSLETIAKNARGKLSVDDFSIWCEP